ncbi:MutS-like protein [Lobulomyces angularis]|nr:MutS-like protein [Lobulomyces angularis]
MATVRAPDVELDQSEVKTFSKFFLNLKKVEGKIRLFERKDGEYYSVHGEDALFVAKHVYKTNSVLKNSPNSLECCFISKLNTALFLRDLLTVRQFRIEIWAAESKNNWKISKKASPGNLTEVDDIIFSNDVITTSPVVISVKIENSHRDNESSDQKVIGVAFTDATTSRKIGVIEFIDNESFSNFESLIVQLGVKECLVVQESNPSLDTKKLMKLLERSRVVVTPRKKTDFALKDLEQDLNRLCEEKISNKPFFDLKVAMAAVASLIKYLGYMSDSTNHGLYEIFQYDLSQYAKLDATAVRALNLLPEKSDGANKNMSLFGLLNKCKTSQGSRLLEQWLKQPLMSLPEINMRLNILEIFCIETELRQSLQETHLKHFPDLSRISKKFQRGTATLQDVVRVYQVIVKLPELKELLEMYEGENSWIIEENFTTKLNNLISSLEKMKELVETTIDLESVEDHEYLIKPDFDDNLKETKKDITLVYKDIENEASKVSRALCLDLDKKLKFEKNSIYGYHLRLTRSDANKIRGNNEFIQLSTQKAGVLFTTKKMKEKSLQHDELNVKYSNLQTNLVKEIIEISATFLPALEPLNLLISQLDVLVSFAHVSIHAPIPFVRPKFSTEKLISLKAARHPCLEMQDDISFISNDVEMVKGQSSFQIITGPNMGGKSTYIRQIGVISLMAQTGCFVPCASATLCLFDSILARVGAGDSQLKGVSTFMAEMLETASILNTATSDSLIIIDELGRGTSTHGKYFKLAFLMIIYSLDGFGLAWSIAEHIATKIECFSLFATHFHELTALSEKVPSVLNRHVKVHTTENDITLLYKVENGICDQSFGIHVAELAKFPKSVVKYKQLAKRKVDELESSQKDEDLKIKKRILWKSDDTEKKDGLKILEEFLDEFKDFDLCNINIENKEKQKEIIKSLENLGHKYENAISKSSFLSEVLLEL